MPPATARQQPTLPPSLLAEQTTTDPLPWQGMPVYVPALSFCAGAGGGRDD